MKAKHTNSPCSFPLSLCGMREKNIHPRFRLSLRPAAPTTLLLCAFFMFFIQWLCIRPVLEILVFPHTPSNWDVIGWTSGRGRVTGRDNYPVCSCALACFLCRDHRNNVIWFSSLYWHSHPAPLLPHSYSCTIWCTFASIACVPGSAECVFNKLYLRAV